MDNDLTIPQAREAAAHPPGPRPPARAAGAVPRVILGDWLCWVLSGMWGVWFQGGPRGSRMVGPPRRGRARARRGERRNATRGPESGRGRWVSITHELGGGWGALWGARWLLMNV